MPGADRSELLRLGSMNTRQRYEGKVGEFETL